MAIKIQYSGYSLYEMMVVVAIIGVLLTLALPSMGTAVLQRNNAITMLQLSSAIKYAQEEALRRGEAVVICPANYNTSNVLTGCLNADNAHCQSWSCGCLAYIDIDNRGDYSTSDKTLDKRIMLSHFTHKVALHAIASPNSADVRRLIIAPNGLIQDNQHSEMWIFSLSQTLFRQTYTSQLSLNSYGAFCQGGQC